MHPGIDISIPLGKLSAPVEVLNIDRRACRTLQRAGVYTVAEVLLWGKPKLVSIKNMGTVTADRIWQAVTSYLEPSEDQLTGEAASPPGSGDVREAPVSALSLGTSTLQTLAPLGDLRIRELAKARASQYRNLTGLGPRELFEIDQGLHHYMARTAQASLRQIVGSDAIPDAPSPEPLPVVYPVPIFQLPRFSKYTWSIIQRRAMQRLSPPETRALATKWERRGCYTISATTKMS